MKLTSQTTFLYVEDMQAARTFFDEVLQLEVVYDPLWACVWRTGINSFLGVVDNKSKRGVINKEDKGSVLISLTVRDIDETYSHLSRQACISYITPIRVIEDIGLRTFLFQGPGGYLFEIQEFINAELQKLF